MSSRRSTEHRVTASFAAYAALALLLANVRYWPAVWPLVRRDLSRWRRRACAIPEQELRALALRKLLEERFNPELAATLATLAPARRRHSAAAAIVALQLSYDLLDAVTERPLPDQLADGWDLHQPFVHALRSHSQAPERRRAQLLDGGYLEGLTDTVAVQSGTLPSTQAIGAVAQQSAARCAEAQVRLHAGALGEDALREGAPRAGALTHDHETPELLAGACASVLCLHALIAAAADPATTCQQARRLDALYASVGALSMLDSVVDREQDLRTGQLNWLDSYESAEQMGARLAALASTALAAAAQLPRSGHHTMTLAGTVAYYASAPNARAGEGGSAIEGVREQLGPLLGPPMIVMRAWRAAKRANVLAIAKLSAATLALALIAVTAVQARGATGAWIASSLLATDSAHLHYVSASGSTLYETGRASGTLPGEMRVHMRISSTFSGSFLIDASGGTIEGSGTARPHGSGRYESFAGTLRVTGGTGRYRHAHGEGHIYGVFDRDSYALTIKTTGKLYY